MADLIADFSESEQTNLSSDFSETNEAKAEVGNLVFGVSATVKVGTVTDGEEAQVVNSGTDRNAVLDFVLPRGKKGEPGAKGDKPEKGVDYWTADDKAELVQGVLDNLPDISPYEIGSGLKLDEQTNTLSVDTAASVEEDNTKPITSAAVYTTVGNIEILLETI